MHLSWSVCEQGAEESVCGLKGMQVRGGWRKLHNDELDDFLLGKGKFVLSTSLTL